LNGKYNEKWNGESSQSKEYVGRAIELQYGKDEFEGGSHVESSYGIGCILWIDEISTGHVDKKEIEHENGIIEEIIGFPLIVSFQ
jgi:hypothetical protein